MSAKGNSNCKWKTTSTAIQPRKIRNILYAFFDKGATEMLQVPSSSLYFRNKQKKYRQKDCPPGY